MVMPNMKDRIAAFFYEPLFANPALFSLLLPTVSIIPLLTINCPFLKVGCFHNQNQ